MKVCINLVKSSPRLCSNCATARLHSETTPFSKCSFFTFTLDGLEAPTTDFLGDWVHGFHVKLLRVEGPAPELRAELFGNPKCLLDHIFLQSRMSGIWQRSLQSSLHV